MKRIENASPAPAPTHAPTHALASAPTSAPTTALATTHAPTPTYIQITAPAITHAPTSISVNDVTANTNSNGNDNSILDGDIFTKQQSSLANQSETDQNRPSFNVQNMEKERMKRKPRVLLKDVSHLLHFSTECKYAIFNYLCYI